MRARRAGGFALVLVLGLLGLLVLATYALSTLVRVNARIGAAKSSQAQARQHALLGLNLALDELQRHAGRDDRITGMAGLSGVSAGAGRPARHWCGVWDEHGVFVTWLVSGITDFSLPDLRGQNAVTLVGAGSLGADTTDKEHVSALRQGITIIAEGEARELGGHAYWVGDEGVKLSAVLNAATPVSGGQHAVNELIPDLDFSLPDYGQVLAYAQLAYVPATALTSGQLQSNFHSMGVTHVRQIAPGGGAVRTESGLLNINSSSARYWRGVAATYNHLTSGPQLSLSPTVFGNRMSGAIPEEVGPGKSLGGPYTVMEAFFAGAVLADALAGSDVSVSDFRETMEPWLTTRSDTFRLRAYGDAVNLVDPDRVEAVAYCEAIVQRGADELPGHGRRFQVISFRWLGPDDI